MTDRDEAQLRDAVRAHLAREIGVNALHDRAEAAGFTGEEIRAEIARQYDERYDMQHVIRTGIRNILIGLLIVLVIALFTAALMAAAVEGAPV